MPVYEFYCGDCHTIFNFLSRRIIPDTRPACPRCGRPELERQVSGFAFSKGSEETDGPIPGMPDLDEARLERAMGALAAEMDGVDENDPRQMARLMRTFGDMTGMKLGSAIEEAIQRLEAGADPEELEQEMGDLLGDDALAEMFAKEEIKGIKRTYTAPAHDETLYPL